MVSARLPALALVATAASALLAPTDARAAFRASTMASSVTKTSFSWTEDPHAADPCTEEPGCFNSVKYGFDVKPMNISGDANVVFQEATRPHGVSAVLTLEIYTQPGCGVSACRVVKKLFISKEECFNGVVEKKATEADGVTAKLSFGGIYYEDSPAGELYAKFEKNNGLTNKNTCTYQVRSGFKRWF